MILECTQAAETPDDTATPETAPLLVGSIFPAPDSQDTAGPVSASEATQAYVQAYHDALLGYRKRHAVVERYSALLPR